MRQVQQVSRSSLSALPPSAFLSARWSISPPPTHQRCSTHLLPFQMVMALNHAGALQLEVNSLFLRREFMDCHAVFFKVWLSKHWEIFPCGRIIFGHSLSSLPQYTTGLWLLLSCIMEQNPVSVPALCTKPPPLPPKKAHWWDVGDVAELWRVGVLTTVQAITKRTEEILPLEQHKQLPSSAVPPPPSEPRSSKLV